MADGGVHAHVGAHIHYGVAGASLATTAVRVGDGVGVGLAVGDVNGDGYDDLLRLEGATGGLLLGSAAGPSATASVTLSLGP